MKMIPTWFSGTAIVLTALCVNIAVAAKDKAEQKQPLKKNQKAVRGIQLPPTLRPMPINFGGTMSSLVQLIPREQIKKEINVTDDQQTKLTEIMAEYYAGCKGVFTVLRGVKDKEKRQKKWKEIMKKRQELGKTAEKKIRESLDEAQVSRLNEIVLQLSGPRALLKEDVVNSLEIKEDQQQKITGVFAAEKEKRKEIFQDMQNGNIKPSELGEKYKKLNESVKNDALKVLTDGQREKFEKMKGKEFKLERKQRQRIQLRKGVQPIRIQIGKQRPAKAVK